MRLLPLALLMACVDPTPYEKPPPLTTEVSDWRDEVIYQLLVDRFANGDINNDYNVSRHPEVLSRYMGGDYQGVIDNVDYLEELGVTAVWISPVVANVEVDAGVSSYHGYWTQDFFQVNPHFGEMHDLREMVEVLHARGIKVIVDIVVNHVGQLFYYDINRNGQPDSTVYGAGLDPNDEISIVTEWDPSYDDRGVQGWTSLGESGPAPLGWVYMPEINRTPPPGFHNDDYYNRRGRVTDWNTFEQVVKGDFPGGLKDLDTTHPEVEAKLIEAFQFWIEQTNIDGYRIDTVKHVEHTFWRKFNPAIRQFAKERGKDNFLQFGEVFDGDDALIGSYTARNELDSLFYFSHKFQVFDDIFKYGGPTTNIENLYNERSVNYRKASQPDGIGISPQQSLINFIDNHDIPRFRFDNSDEAALQAAILYLLTMDGIPCIYYGTEQAFVGGNDPSNREALWDSAYDTRGATFVHTRDLIRLRKTYRPLRRGDFQIRWVSDRVGTEEDAHIAAFEREAEGDSALVVVNTGAGTSHTSFQGNDMPVPNYAPNTELQVVYPVGDERTYTVSAGGTVKIELGPYEGLVLVPKSDVLELVD